MLNFKFMGLLALEKKIKYFVTYSTGSHLGHVTWIIYINIHSLFARRIMKFGFACPSDFREDV